MTTEAIQPITELFTASAEALWATTYSIDLTLINEFLLPRLGEPPLNFVVLADHHRLASSLERVPVERTETLGAVNRHWLLRSVRLPGGAFHPKSYLFVGRGRAKLLVGSGNVSMGGLDDGCEIFTLFESGTAVGDGAIASWAEWMRRLVQRTGDMVLADRFSDLMMRLSKLPNLTAGIASPLIHNLDEPIGDQICGRIEAEVGASVDELHLTAPFYDRDADAVAYLLTRLQPRQVQVYLARSTSVDGGRLAERLAASGAEVAIFLYEPDCFVHAKLIGIVAGSRAWSLSGSVNLSRAALTLATNQGGNVELAVLTPLEPEAIRSLFIPPRMKVNPLDPGDLLALRIVAEEETNSASVTLASASATNQGLVQIWSQPSPMADWRLSDLTSSQPLTIDPSGRAVTVGPLNGRLVEIVDAGGKPLSNRVVIDYPSDLVASLTARPEAVKTGPPELPDDHDSLLIRALQQLHRDLVMDVTERLTGASTGGIGATESDKQADDEFWERLEKEQLASDPRAETYRRRRAWDGSNLSEPVLEVLEAMRSGSPAASVDKGSQRSLIGRLLESHPLEVANRGRWKTSSRVRLRARNLLRRWAAAQSDRRLVWVEPLAPSVNFAAICGTFAYLHLECALNPNEVELTSDDLDDLWLLWVQAFVGTGNKDGWIDQLDAPSLDLMHQRLPTWLPEAAAALCWFLVQPGKDYRNRVIACQPSLTTALTHGLLNPTDLTAQYLTEVTGNTITRVQIDEQLLAATEFIDDGLWCTRMAEELALEEITLRAPPGIGQIGLRLDVQGIADPLLDTRVPRLVIAARRYRRCDGISLFAEDGGWRLSIRTGQTIDYLPNLGNVSVVKSENKLEPGALEHLAATGGVLASLFPGGTAPCS